ncbi:MAG: ABC transporter ATP-binding protein [Anaerolineales bacterium]|nr:MAG: ABC transporter ATP-binding protein [Anaerolineales bacterium]
MSSLLEVTNLTVRFSTQDGLVHAVNGISYTLEKGENLGIVGESGSGKSVGVLSLLGLIPTPPGEILYGNAMFAGKDLLKVSQDELRSIRGNTISMIFQDPMTSLNPVLTIGRQITEALEIHLNMKKEDARVRAVELLKMVGIPLADERFNNYPHQFSGGMRQRAMIAMALSCNPELLIADEPTTALDVTIQAQIVRLVKRLQKEIKMAVIWITHDLGVVAGLADRVIVMYAGRIAEIAPVKQLYANPRHPYTLGLLRSLPRVDADRPETLASIDGLPPDLINYPQGCPFYARCNYRIDRCLQAPPPLETIGKNHQSACFVDITTAQPTTENPYQEYISA